MLAFHIEVVPEVSYFCSTFQLTCYFVVHFGLDLPRVFANKNRTLLGNANIAMLFCFFGQQVCNVLSRPYVGHFYSIFPYVMEVHEFVWQCLLFVTFKCVWCNCFLPANRLDLFANLCIAVPIISPPELLPTLVVDTEYAPLNNRNITTWVVRTYL